MRLVQRRAKKLNETADREALKRIPGKHLSGEHQRTDRGRRTGGDGIPILHKFLEAILALGGGRVRKFQPVPPPPDLRRLLRRATRRQLQGAMLEILRALGNGGK